MKPKILVITGGNKGIGYHTVRDIIQQTTDKIIIYLTARDEQLGLKAVNKLNEQFIEKKHMFELRYFKLDISDEIQLNLLYKEIESEHGCI